jgi:uncharacterized Zn-binding protein involved in type VI secretion
MALGIPHAHVKHPPSGPPPVPPTPLPPTGPILFGTNSTVLINNQPTARCGDIGINPTCCGIAPPTSAMYEIVTGSSNVYIGGARAARSGIDITMHCFHLPAPKIPLKLAKFAAVASKAAKVVSKVSAAAAKVSNFIDLATNLPDQVAQAAEMAADFVEAVADDAAAVAKALALKAAMMAKQAAIDAAVAALTSQIGTDQPCIPPVGTPGMILDGSANVLIGGFPLPSFSAIAQGLLKRLQGLKGSGGGGGGCPVGAPPST